MISNRNNEVQVKNFESSSTNPTNKGNETLLSIELGERKLALLERQVKLRKETAEAEAIELKNQQTKKFKSSSLHLYNSHGRFCNHELLFLRFLNN